MWTNVSEGLFSIVFKFNLQFNTILMPNYTATAPVFTSSQRQLERTPVFFFIFQGVNDDSACVFKVLSRGTSCE